MSHSFLEEVPAHRLTSDTIRKMYELIDQGKLDPKFQELAYTITKGLRNKDYRGEVSRFFDYAKKNIRYTRDPHGVELVQDVWATLERGRADCDDFTILLGALCEVMGAPIRIITVSTRPDKEPVHVYPEALVGARWMPLDVTVAGSTPGWAPKRITDRVIWTRKDVGISGYDEDNVEGIGMFKPTVVPIDLTPGVPNDISHTYADPLRGPQVVSRRKQPGAPYAPVASSSEIPEAPESGSGRAYNPPLRILPFPLPRELWSQVPRASVPIKVNAWPDEPRPWKKDWSAMLPNTHVPEDKFMTNLNGLGGLDLEFLDNDENDALESAIQSDVTRQVRAGAVPPSAAPYVVSKTVDAVQSGDHKILRTMPATQKVVKSLSQRASSGSTPATTPGHAPTKHMIRHPNIREHANDYGCESDESCEWMPAMYGLGGNAKNQNRARLYAHVHQLVKHRLPTALHDAGVHPRQIQGLYNPRTFRAIRAGAVAGLGELGQTPLPVDPSTTANAAGTITDSIMQVVDPNDAKAVDAAVSAGVRALVGAAPKPVATSGFSLNLGGWGVPLLVVAAIAAAATFMAKPRKLKYRRNPSRRRSSSRRRRGGSSGGGFAKYAPWLLAGGAAYMIFTPKKAPVAGQPAQSGILSSIMNLFKPTSAQTAGGAATAAASPITSLFNSIFGTSKMAAPTPTTQTATSTYQPSKMVFDSDLQSSQPSSPSGMVTSLDTTPSYPSGADQMVTDYES